jgi:hypothetical protein
MWSVLTDLLIGIFEFVIDVVLFRGLRSKHGSSKRSITEDALEIAYFDFVTITFTALACFALILFLVFGLGLPAGWSVGIGIAVTAAWIVWRYFQLVRER